MKKSFLSVAVSLTALLLQGAPPMLQLDRNAATGGFIATDGAWAEYPSEVAIARVPGGLQFLYTAYFGNDPKVTVVPGKKDSPAILSGESIELQLSPRPESGDYFHFGINPDGTIYSAKRKDASWDPARIVCDVKRFPRYWQVAVELPFEALGVPEPKKGEVWKVNFARTRAGTERQTTSWSGASGFHDLSRFGTLQFGSVSPAELVLAEHSPFGFEALFDLSGSADRRKIEMVEDGKTVASFDIPPGETRRVRVRGRRAPGAIPVKENSERSFRVFDGKDGKKLFEKSGRLLTSNAALLLPDRYYYTPADQAIRYTTTHSGIHTIRLTDDAGKTVFSEERRDRKGEIPLSALTPGRYTLTLEHGGLTASRVLFLQAAVPTDAVAAGTVFAIAGDTFTAGGKPVYLLAGSHTGKAFLRHGPVFNLALGNFGNQENALHIKDVPGKKLVRTPGTGYLFPASAAYEEVLKRFAAESVREPFQLRRLAYEAQMKVYFPEQGKMAEKVPHEFYSALYRKLKEAGVKQPLSLQIDHPDVTSLFAPACDVFEITCAGGYDRSPLPKIEQGFRDVKKLVPNKPLLHWIGVTIPDNHCRTAEELRAELYLGMLHGGAGAILHMGHGFLPEERSRLWSLISQIGPELRALYPEFKSGTPAAFRGPDGFTVALREFPDRWLLIAVNRSMAPRRFEATLPDGRKISAGFTAWEPRVFRIGKN